jgi:3-hydroxy-9,10-secoandrosta-1,3,5(10)-triene-9,17-dione monooxygenase
MATVMAGGNNVGTLPQATRRDFSGVDYDEAMRRARALVPTLRERAQQSEDARVLLRDNEQLLHETGLFRFHQPRAFGGMELPFVAVVDIVAELARLPVHRVERREPGRASLDPRVLRPGDAARGLGRQPRRAHRLVDRARRRARRPADGGFVVSGRWPFSSGVDNSEWNMLAVTVYGDDGKTPSTGACAWYPRATTRSSTRGRRWEWSERAARTSR